jgi:hypothetical protein
MQRSIRVCACHKTGMRMLKDVHSTIMVISITGLGNLLEVRLSIWHFQFVRALWVVSFSLTGFPLARSSLIFLPLHPSDFFATTMSCERGKSKCGPAYYSFMARRLDRVLLPHQFRRPPLALPLLVLPLWILPSQIRIGEGMIAFWFSLKKSSLWCPPSLLQPPI